MSPAAIVATMMVVGCLKMLASMKGIYLGGWPHQRWLAITEKCPKSSSSGRKPIAKKAWLASYVEALLLMVGLSL